MSLRVHDTLRNDKLPFETLEPGKVRMYVCGVTPYARSHLGHARCYIAYDIIYRYLQFSGYEVTYVRNITDVDDKIIARAIEKGCEAYEFACGQIDTFYADMDALNIARPHLEPRVSTSMPEIIALVSQLVEKGLAYEAEGDVYFAVTRFPEYGKLSKRSLEDMQAGARVEVSAKKQHPMDFALWKAAKPGEPKWDSPWGPGRPGWHIECSAMVMQSLGPSVDIHGGGQDLIFPHHENEIAQSEGATGVPFSRFWLHNGFVSIDDEKMSKSLGNVFNVSDLLGRYEPQVLRLYLLGTHYRNPINFSDLGLDEAASRMAYFYETLRKAEVFLDTPVEVAVGALPGEAFIDQLEAQFREALDDDFNAARALALLAEAFKLLNELITTKKAKQLAGAVTAARKLRAGLERIDAVLALFGEDAAEYLQRHREKAALRLGLSIPWIAERVGDRLVARAEKDWARADSIRDELAALGIVLMDGAQGTDWTIQDLRGTEKEAQAE